MTTHSSILAWKIPWGKEPGGLQFKGWQRNRHDLSVRARAHTHTHTHIVALPLAEYLYMTWGTHFKFSQVCYDFYFLYMQGFPFSQCITLDSPFRPPVLCES